MRKKSLKRRIVKATCDSIEHWQRNKYQIDGSWSEGCCDDECDLCKLHYELELTCDEICPLAIVGHKCTSFNGNTSWFIAANTGRKDQLLQALEMALAYSVLQCIAEEFSEIVRIAANE